MIEIKILAIWWIKYLRALESHFLMCTIIRILTVIITPCSSDIPSLGPILYYMHEIIKLRISKWRSICKPNPEMGSQDYTFRNPGSRDWKFNPGGIAITSDCRLQVKPINGAGTPWKSSPDSAKLTDVSVTAASARSRNKWLSATGNCTFVRKALTISQLAVWLFGRFFDSFCFSCFPSSAAFLIYFSSIFW